MKINKIEAIVLSLPLSVPIETNLHIIKEIIGIELSVYNSENTIYGTSFIRGFGLISYNDIMKAINEIKTLLLNQNILLTKSSWNKFWRDYKNNKTAAEIYALAAFDIAMWDLFAKISSVPIYKLINCQAPILCTL